MDQKKSEKSGNVLNSKFGRGFLGDKIFFQAFGWQTTNNYDRAFEAVIRQMSNCHKSLRFVN